MLTFVMFPLSAQIVLLKFCRFQTVHMKYLRVAHCWIIFYWKNFTIVNANFCYHGAAQRTYTRIRPFESWLHTYEYDVHVKRSKNSEVMDNSCCSIFLALYSPVAQYSQSSLKHLGTYSAGWFFRPSFIVIPLPTEWAVSVWKCYLKLALLANSPRNWSWRFLRRKFEMTHERIILMTYEGWAGRTI
jgi:hypothetical protein